MRQPDMFPEVVLQSSSLTAHSESCVVRETILVVEDEAFVRDVTCEILKYAGYGVLKARNAMEAKVLFGQHQGVVQLLLTDVVLPGQSGGDLAAELRTTFPAIRIIFTSGYPTNPVTRSGVVADGVSYLPKPFSSESLLRKVSQVLRPSRKRMPV